MGEEKSGGIDAKAVILGLAVVIILGLVVTTPGWQEVFGLNFKVNSGLLLYGGLAVGLVALVLFAMNSK